MLLEEQQRQLTWISLPKHKDTTVGDLTTEFVGRTAAARKSGLGTTENPPPPICQASHRQ